MRRRNGNNNGQRKKKGRKQQRRNRSRSEFRGQHAELRFREFIPQSLSVKLPYTGNFLLTNSSLFVASKALRTNSVYDVDPALGSTDTQGYTRFAEDYNYYRVVKYKYKITVVNQNNFPLDFVVISSISNLTGSTGIGTTDLTTIQNNPSAQSRVIAEAAGGNPSYHIFKKTMRPEQVEGTIMARTDDHYQSLTGNSPANLTWICFSASAFDKTSPLVNNLNVRVELWMYVQFYGRGTSSS